jgi:starvation-inducible DNA-binding protein
MRNDNVANSLNRILADSTVLYEKLHAFHWLVQGREFFTLHAKLEELYDHWHGVIDDVAERILTIGGKPIATLAGVLKHATIEEYDGISSGQEIVEAVRADFQHMIKSTGDAIAQAEETGDRGTVNLLDGMRDNLEKSVWMLNAVLGG